MVHALLVRIVTKKPEHVDTIVERIAALYHHSNTNEPDTLTYELQRPEVAAEASDEERDKAARTLLILERYTSKAALTDVHCQSAPFKANGEWLTVNFSDNLESVVFEHYDRVEPPAVEVSPAAAAGDEASSAKAKGADDDNNGILVFCGARPGTTPTYVEHGKRVGEIIAASGRPLVYGGGTVGVMGAVAEAVAGNGGNVIGVIPKALSPREASGQLIGDVHIVSTMAERKDLMFSRANWLVCLPGGIGTLDELFEVLTLCQLNAYKCRVGLLNTENFYGPLVAMMHHLVTQKFLEQETVDAIVVRDTPEELFNAMKDAKDFEASGNARELKW